MAKTNITSPAALLFTWFAIAVLVALPALALSPSRAAAAQLMSDTFTYPNGNLVGNGGWTAHSGATVGSVAVNNNRILVVQSSSTNEDVNKGLSVITGATAKTYASFKLTVTDTTALSATTYFALFRPAPPDTNLFRTRLYVARDSAVAGRYKIGLSSGTAGAGAASIVYFPGSYAVGDRHIVVSAYDAATGTSTLWVDPLSEASTSVSATVAADGGRQIKQYAFRQGTLSGHTLTEAVDDVAVGTTFSDAILTADIGITALCVAHPVSKACIDTLPAKDPWHAAFTVVNKGVKEVNSWTYSLALTNLTHGYTVQLVGPTAGPGLLPGGSFSPNIDPAYLIDRGGAGPWRLTLTVAVTEANQSDPTAGNNVATDDFVVTRASELPGLEPAGMAALFSLLAGAGALMVWRRRRADGEPIA